MTPRELEVLDFVRDYIELFRFAPTLREIGDKFGFSVPYAWRLVDSLVEAGALVKPSRGARALELGQRPDTVDLTCVSSLQLRGELGRRGLTLDALMIPEPLAYSGRSCAATCCGIAVERGKLMCRRHWMALPHALQKNIVAAFYARAHDEYREYVREAIDLADAFQGVIVDRAA